MKAYYNGVSLYDPDGLFIDSVDGWGSNVDLKTNTMYGTDGTTITGQDIQSKEITLNILLDTEADKALLRQTFKLKDTGYLIIDGKRIECVVKSIEISYKRPWIAEVILYAPSPFYSDEYGGGTAQMRGENDVLEFDIELPEDDALELSIINDRGAVAINNNGDVDIGCIITVEARQAASGIKITNADTGAYMALDYSVFAGAKVVFDTRAGHKSITIRQIGATDESVVDITRFIKWQSEFIQLVTGKNRLYITADTGLEGMSVSVSYAALYGGI